MSLIVLLLKLIIDSWVAIGCNNNEDCNYLGQCDISSSSCICNQGWYGTVCDETNISSTINWSIDGYHDPNGLSTWDGSPIFDPKTNKWHLYITILTENCTANQWLSNSVIAHIVSTSSNAIGPYQFSDIALSYQDDLSQWDALSVYTPIVIKDIYNKNDKYYMFYVGTTLPDAVHLNCTATPDPGRNVTLRNNQNIGYAYSSSLYGPWIRSKSNPIIKPRRYNSTLWDSAYVCNPDPYYLSNGTLIVIYKGIQQSTMNTNFSMNTGVAININNDNPQSWDGPYKRFDSYFNDPGNCEDGWFWESIDEKNNNFSSYHIEYHCKCNGSHAYSLDLMNWTYGEQQPWCDITLNNGTIKKFTRRERPAIMFKTKSNIDAQVIFSAVQQPNGQTSFNLVQEL